LGYTARLYANASIPVKFVSQNKPDVSTFQGLILALQSYWAEQGCVIVGIAEDITEKKRLEGELHRLATTDVLTQSSNRRHFFECARSEFEQARQFVVITSGAITAFKINRWRIPGDNVEHTLGTDLLKSAWP
jgi:predicted signal transduction protein with EAL and GGDEF domain